jgi:hypothetical protein
MKLTILRWVFRELYERIVGYVKDHPELDGASLRLRIRSVFGTSLSAAQLDKLISLVRRGA